MAKNNQKLILASASPRRLALLAQVGIVPDLVAAADIDETPKKNEKPVDYAMRVAREKVLAIASENPDAIVLAADTIVVCGNKILPKAEDEKTAKWCLKQLSGRRHRVYTAVCVLNAGKEYSDICLTRVRFLPLTEPMISGYIASGEWQGKAGGYAIQGRAEAFIPWISGSYSNVVGLPLSETMRLLKRPIYLSKKFESN